MMRAKARRFLGRFSVTEKGLLVTIIVCGIGLAVLSPVFLTAGNLLNVTRQMALVAIIGVGECYCIISGEFDLSVGSTLGLVAMVTALLITAGWGYLALILGLLVGAFVGVLNGILVTKVKIPSFIVTLGMLMLVRGLILATTKGWPVPLPASTPRWFFYLGQGRPWGIPMQAIVMVIVLLIGNLILSRTKIGYHMYAVGGSARSAHLNGISVTKIKIFAFVVTGFLAAIAGILSLSFIQTGNPQLGTLMELDIITAVVIGGTAIRGGRGSILGVFLGALIWALILNGLILLGVEAYYSKVVMGIIIIGAVAASTIKEPVAYLKA